LPQTLVMGIDGGQSTTRALIADMEGNLLGLGVGGASNHIH
jgi:N-acetylglucosamine kinase-like BadF-type ATPase